MATARTVVATTARAMTMAARAPATGGKQAMAMMAMMAMMGTMAMTAMMATMASMATMIPNGKDDAK